MTATVRVYNVTHTQLTGAEFILVSTVSTLTSMTTQLACPGQLSCEDQSDCEMVCKQYKMGTFHVSQLKVVTILAMNLARFVWILP